MTTMRIKAPSVLLVFLVFHYGSSSPEIHIPEHLKLDEADNLEFPFHRRLDICDENILLNSDGNSENGSLDLWEGKRCTIISIDDGYLPGSKSIKATNRNDVAAGPAQQFSQEQLNCLVEGDSMTVSLRLRLEDENGNPFACNGSTWNVPSTCPMVSFWVEPSSSPVPWSNHWNDANLADSGGWQADEWNLFTSTFDVTSEMANADSIYFTVRGPATDIDVFMSDPIFTFATPSSAPSIPSSIISSAPTFSPNNSGNSGNSGDNGNSDSTGVSANAGSSSTTTGSSTESLTGGSAGTATESSAGSSTESLTGSSTESSTGSSTESSTANSGESSNDSTSENSNNSSINNADGITNGNLNEDTNENSNENENETSNGSTSGSSNDSPSENTSNNMNGNLNGSTNESTNNTSNQNNAGNVGRPNQNNSGRPNQNYLYYYLRKRSRIRSRTFRSYN